jgi:LCP family protein required for cell wall assembly
VGLASLAGGAVLLGLVALLVPPRTLLAWSLVPQVLSLVAIGLAGLVLLWIVVAAVSLRLLEPAGLGTGRRLVASLLTVTMTSLVAVPLALTASRALIQRDLVTTIFTATSDSGSGVPESHPPAVPVKRVDPWGRQGRVNVLIMGGDGGADRIGVRPDTNIVASIDTKTGDAVLFSLPRNLQRVPFPSDSPLSDRYPNGFVNGPESESLLNAIYLTVPALQPDLFTGSPNPGADAMKLAAEGVTGLQVDYYVLVNLKGFQQLVDALGGIDINVKERIPVGNKRLASGYCSTPDFYIEPGQQHLNGYRALWFARARCGGEGVSDDYDRMRRQRCVIGAIIDQAEPLTVVRKYQQLAKATKDIVSTDIPQDRLAAFVELGMKVKDADVTTLPFTNKVIATYDPDYKLIRRMVKDAIVDEPKSGATTGSADAGSSGSDGAGSGGDGATDGPADESSGAQSLDTVC